MTAPDEPCVCGTEFGHDCRNCGCPWDSCLVHTEFCCDACSHPDGSTP